MKDENYAPGGVKGAGLLSGIPKPHPIGSAAANRNANHQPGSQYNSTSAAGYSSKNAQGHANSRSLLQNIQMRSKKNKHEGSHKLKMAGAASLQRDGNNSELGQIAPNSGYVPQAPSVGTPSGFAAGLNLRKAESNQVKVTATPLQ